MIVAAPVFLFSRYVHLGCANMVQYVVGQAGMIYTFQQENECLVLGAYIFY